MKIISTNISITKIINPYTVWVIDDFLKKEVIEKISNNWLDPDNSAWNTAHTSVSGKKNLLEQGMRGISKLELMPKAIAEVSAHLHSQDFTDQIGKILEIENLIADKAMRWSGMRTMLPGSFQLIHSDARLQPETGLRKEITVLFYTQPNYNAEKDTGHLEIWDDNMKECIHKIAPKYNTAIVFLNSDTSYHGVPDVNFERRGFTFSILKDAEASNRSKALFVARPNDSVEVRKQGEERSKIPDSKDFKKI